MGQARNLAVVLSADVVIAVGGELGTLSEIALALTHGVPVVALRSWRLDHLRAGGRDLEDFHVADDSEAAVAAALRLAGGGRLARAAE